LGIRQVDEEDLNTHITPYNPLLGWTLDFGRGSFLLGELLGEVLSVTGGQIGDKSGTNPYFTDILFMGEHTQMGSTPVISTISDTVN